MSSLNPSKIRAYQPDDSVTDGWGKRYIFSAAARLSVQKRYIEGPNKIKHTYKSTKNDEKDTEISTNPVDTDVELKDISRDGIEPKAKNTIPDISLKKFIESNPILLVDSSTNISKTRITKKSTQRDTVFLLAHCPVCKRRYGETVKSSSKVIYMNDGFILLSCPEHRKK